MPNSKVNLSKDFPEWGRIAYRFARVAFVTAAAQSFVDICGFSFSIENVIRCAPDKLNNPEQLVQTVSISLVSGFLIALGMRIRDVKGENSKLSKLMPF